MRSKNMQSNRRQGFTLVELLVVISIIALLLGILMPVLGKARQIARRTGCKAQLHDIALAFRMYLDQSNNKMPPAAGTPYSVTDLTSTLPIGKQPIVYYLGTYLSMPSDEVAQLSSKKVYCKTLSCPADRNLSYGTPPDYIDRSLYYGMAQFWFKSQTTSYQYQAGLGNQILDKRAFRSGTKISDIEAIGDFDAFHGKKPANSSAEAKANTIGSYNYLFCDCHVGDRKGY